MPCLPLKTEEMCEIAFESRLKLENGDYESKGIKMARGMTTRLKQTNKTLQLNGQLTASTATSTSHRLAARFRNLIKSSEKQ